MPTAERAPRRLGRGALALAGLLAGAPLAWAHPVSQGALAVTIRPDHVRVQATVSPEEVLVASSQTPPAARQGYGAYLLAHLQVVADGRALAGRVVTERDVPGERPSYTLHFPLAAPPARLELRQDVLREFLFAPGNPWEASYLVRVDRGDGAPTEGMLLTAREPLLVVGEASPHAWTATAGAFVRHGIRHILTGYDHLLFIGALVLAVVDLWDLVKVVSAFTVAHTVTLTLAALGVVRLPGTVVEPLIAASIVVVAVENVLRPERSRGASRLAVAFLFGLCHGLGFAGGLLDAMAGMPTASAAVAIASFSGGVEIGHQAVVLPVFAGLRLLRHAGADPHRPRRLALRYGSAAISLAGMLYLAAALRQIGVGGSLH